jgi:hypothetical protein
LRARTCHPHHAFEIWSVVASWTTPTSALGRQQRPDQRPLAITDTKSVRLTPPPKDSLESMIESQVKLCPRGLVM